MAILPVQVRWAFSCAFHYIYEHLPIFSGPKRYDYSPATDSWVYLRDGGALGDLLNTELSTALGKTVKIGLEAVSEKVEDWRFWE